jgi:limonene-1,2-epoxide hydrolase
MTIPRAKGTAADPSHEERAAFLKRFERFGAEASVETYLALFHPEAQLFDDGMERPIGVAEIPAHIEGVLALVRGFRMRVERWRARGRVVFVEAHNAGAIAGKPIAWRAAYRIELDGSLVRDGRRYFDRAPLLAALDPSRPTLLAALAPGAGPELPEPDAVPGTDASPEALVRDCADAWSAGRPERIAGRFREDGALVTPGVARPLGRAEVGAHYRRLAALVGAPLAPRSWAGDESLAFVEWEARPTAAGARRAGLVERFDLRDGLVLSARHYFDSSAAPFARAGDTAG